MKYSHLVFLCLSITALSSGCGRGLGELTAEQKATLKQATRKASTAYSVVTSNGGGSGLKMRHLDDSSLDDSRSSMFSRLSDGLSNGKCKMNQSSGRAGYGDVEITGSDCPLTYGMKVQADSNEVKFRIAYKVQDEEYKKLSDIYAASIEMLMHGIQTQEKFVSMTGGVESLEFGNIKFAFESKVSPKDALIKIRYDFPSFAAELKAEANEKGQKYYLNNKEISEDEMKDYLKGFEEALSSS